MAEAQRRYLARERSKRWWYRLAETGRIAHHRVGDSIFFRPDDIEKFRANIDDAIRQVNQEQEFRQKVRAAYETLKAQGLSITRDKAAVMRKLSTQFPRERMGHVYAAIARLGE